MKKYKWIIILLNLVLLLLYFNYSVIEKEQLLKIIDKWDKKIFSIKHLTQIEN